MFRGGTLKLKIKKEVSTGEKEVPWRDDMKNGKKHFPPRKRFQRIRRIDWKRGARKFERTGCS